MNKTSFTISAAELVRIEKAMMQLYRPHGTDYTDDSIFRKIERGKKRLLVRALEQNKRLRD